LTLDGQEKRPCHFHRVSCIHFSTIVVFPKLSAALEECVMNGKDWEAIEKIHQAYGEEKKILGGQLALE